MPVLCIYLFGKLKAQYGEQELIGLKGRKLQELLCYLLLHRNRPHPREILADQLWGDRCGAHGRKSLRQSLLRLQNTLNSQPELAKCGLLWVEPDWIQLNPEANLWLDVAEFERAFGLVASIPDEELELQDVRTLERAVDLYRGDVLEGWNQDWCLVERERLQDVYLSMLDKLMAYCEATHQYQAGLAYGARMLSYDRAQERTHRRLMRLHYLAGHRTRGLRQYQQRCTAILDQELGVKPARRALALYEQIRANGLKETLPASTGPGAPALPELPGRLEEVLPSLVQQYPRSYGDIKLRDFCLKMHQFNQSEGLPDLLNKAFEKLPQQMMNPSEAYDNLVRGKVEQVPAAKMEGRTVAMGVVPYPPGIPLLMPGEKVNHKAVDYLKALQDFDLKFPGFEHEVHGVESRDGKYLIYCLDEAA